MAMAPNVITPATLGLDQDAPLEALMQAGASHLWLHASPTQALATQADRRILVEGRGCRVTDAQGRTYLDALSGQWLVNVGHGREEIAEAMARQAKALAYGNASRAATLPAIQLAAVLAHLTPGDLSTVFFSSGGSEAVESALKIARQYHALRGEPERYKVIARRGSYHGATYGAMSASGSRSGVDSYFGPLLSGTLSVSAPYCYRCDYRKTYPECDVYCVDAIEDLLRYESPNTVAAVIAEPISAACGIVVPPVEYLPRLREICDRHGVLLILDEVITGFGRTGKMFASEHWGVVPDIMTLAKGLSSGYAPIAATVCRQPIADVFGGANGKAIGHLLTFGGQPVACAAALANLEILQRENLVGNAEQQGAYLLSRLHDLASRHPSVGDVRGLGLLCALELVADRRTQQPFPVDGPEINYLLKTLAELGVLTRAEGNLYLAPPLCIARHEIDELAGIVDTALSHFEEAYSYL
ncbi:aminotransferase family protein [Candidatus Entotheonella palauensis]|uniref:aminotransferase family protein n=1 Tax=Candidatus Entotheonella palauensis TaxID=93172 RepID=UPI0015C471F3|nr:aspartate aminotransferase family protein [Candidatus Entotheonella palauensis]